MSRSISSLKPGEVVWESCQYGNMRYTVVGEPYNSKVRPTYWECNVKSDSGKMSTIGEDMSYRALGIYDEPAYTGVPWHCAPENIPAWARSMED